MDLAVAILLILLTLASSCCTWSQSRLLVRMTPVYNASKTGGRKCFSCLCLTYLFSSALHILLVCLDGSLPAYHLHKGFGAGARNWLLQFEGGGWCNDVESCLERAKSRRGSTKYMNKVEDFNGILSNNASLNPDFYNWNRVKLRYCDGGSFSGDAKFDNGTSVLYFRGQKIWEAIITDLLPKGLGNARKALLSGCSAGGLSSFLHCKNFARIFPKNTNVKCLGDAGFFLDEIDISANRTMTTFFKNLVSLQGIEKNLNENCTSLLDDPKLCIFPQYSLKYIATPFFVLNTAYDVYQFHHALVPPSSDLNGHWKLCKLDIESCNPMQLKILQGFRLDMLLALRPFLTHSPRVGMFINSCFAHCQSETQDTWFAVDSPITHNKTMAEAVGDWYFSRNRNKLIDCAYPCDTSCRNVVS